MDHSLRTISYIADIGDILVVMARRGPVANPSPDSLAQRKRQSKICCHVFESDEVSGHCRSHKPLHESDIKLSDMGGTCEAGGWGLAGSTVYSWQTHTASPSLLVWKSSGGQFHEMLALFSM